MIGGLGDSRATWAAGPSLQGRRPAL